MSNTSTGDKVVPSPLDLSPTLAGQDSVPKPGSEYQIFLRPLYAVPCGSCSERLRACVKAIDPEEKRCQGCHRGRNNCPKASPKHRELSGLWAWIDRRRYMLCTSSDELRSLPEGDIEPSSLALAKNLASDQIKFLQLPTAAQVRREESTSSRLQLLEDRLKKLPLIEIPEEEDAQDADYRPEEEDDARTQTDTETSSMTWNSSESYRIDWEPTAEPSSGTSGESSTENFSGAPSNGHEPKPKIGALGSRYLSMAASGGSPGPWTPWMEARYVAEHPEPGFGDVVMLSRKQLENEIGKVVLDILETAATGGVVAVNVERAHDKVKEMLDDHFAKILGALDAHLAKILEAGSNLQPNSGDGDQT